MKALADASVAELRAKGLGRQDDPASGRSDSQLIAIVVVPIGRSDQLISSEAISFMIDKCVGCRADPQSDRDCKIGFGIDITASVGDRRADRLGARLTAPRCGERQPTGLETVAPVRRPCATSIVVPTPDASATKDRG